MFYHRSRRFLFLTPFQRYLMATLDQIQSDVTANGTVIGSAVTLLGSLKTSLDDAIAANNAGDNGQALATLSATLEAQTLALSQAIAANTPAAAAPAPSQPTQTTGTTPAPTDTSVSPGTADVNTSAPVFDPNTGAQVAGPGVTDSGQAESVTNPAA